MIDDPKTPAPERANILFRASAVLAAIFCVTVLALIAAMGGGGGSPVAKFLNENGGTIISVEVAATLFCAVGAMTLDRRRTLRAGEHTIQDAADQSGASDIDASSK